MAYALTKVGEILGLRVEDDTLLDGFSPLDEARPGTLTWTREKIPEGCKAEAVIGPPGSGATFEVEDPRAAMSEVMNTIASYWADTTFDLFDGAVIAQDTIIGEGCSFAPGVVIGDCGFAFDEYKDGLWRFPHLGKVIIGNFVEVCANAHIARGSLKDTVLEDFVKVDSNVHIAHNVHIGERSLITAGAVIGGSVTIGKRVWVGLNAVIRDGLTIGDDACIGMGAVVVKDVPAGQTVIGNPARPYHKEVSENWEWWNIKVGGTD